MQPGHRDERGIGGIQSVEVVLVVAVGSLSFAAEGVLVAVLPSCDDGSALCG